MTAADFGIYVMTYPGDDHLSTMLVRSIQQVSPDIPIMIIPGEGFDLDDHPFDVPVMPLPARGFWVQIGHQDRDFWAFQGPFRTFLYLDADTIVVKSLDDLARRIVRQEGEFIYIHSLMEDEEWTTAVTDPDHPDHAEYRQMVQRDIGHPPLERFDPQHDFYAHKPFNSGVWAGSRGAISEADLSSLNEAERKFYREFLGIADWTWKSSELFFRDQGRLNYLVRKLNIPTYPLEPDLVVISGARSVHVTTGQVRDNSCDFHVIHWMGAKSPSPSLFCSGLPFSLYAYLWAYVGERSGRFVMPGYDKLPEAPGYSVWRDLYRQSSGPFTLRDRLRWTARDLKKVGKLLQRWLRLKCRAALSGGQPGE